MSWESRIAPDSFSFSEIEASLLSEPVLSINDVQDISAPLYSVLDSTFSELRVEDWYILIAQVLRQSDTAHGNRIITPWLLGQPIEESSGAMAVTEWESLFDSLWRVNENPYVSEVLQWIQQSGLPTQEQQSAELLDWISLRDRLQAFQEEGDSVARVITERLRSLRMIPDSEDEDDVPLSDQAALGFFDFLDTVNFHGLDIELTTAHGWLCSEWSCGDGRAVVIWFKNQEDTMLTAFGSDGQLLRHLGQNPVSHSWRGAADLLIQENFFSWRHEK